MTVTNPSSSETVEQTSLQVKRVSLGIPHCFWKESKIFKSVTNSSNNLLVSPTPTEVQYANNNIPSSSSLFKETFLLACEKNQVQTIDRNDESGSNIDIEKSVDDPELSLRKNYGTSESSHYDIYNEPPLVVLIEDGKIPEEPVSKIGNQNIDVSSQTQTYSTIPNYTRFISRPRGNLICFPENSFPLTNNENRRIPMKILCGVSGCQNEKKYACSKTKVPLCSLNCYRKNLLQTAYHE